MKEFLPAFKFVGIFLGLYLVLNFAYAFWIETVRPAPDRATILVTHHTAKLLALFGEDTGIKINDTQPTVSLLKSNSIVVNVFEGCNSINVMIVFIAFLMAFGGSTGNLLWFAPLGLSIIYFFNVLRVALLYYVSAYWQQYFYYIHKYAFTAFIYSVVFTLWWIWIEKVSGVSLRNILSTRKP